MRSACESHLGILAGPIKCILQLNTTSFLAIGILYHLLIKQSSGFLIGDRGGLTYIHNYSKHRYH
jgi:hypothetical protein